MRLVRCASTDEWKRSPNRSSRTGQKRVRAAMPLGMNSSKGNARMTSMRPWSANDMTPTQRRRRETNKAGGAPSRTAREGTAGRPECGAPIAAGATLKPRYSGSRRKIKADDVQRNPDADWTPVQNRSMNPVRANRHAPQQQITQPNHARRRNCFREASNKKVKDRSFAQPIPVDRLDERAKRRVSCAPRNSNLFTNALRGELAKRCIAPGRIDSRTSRRAFAHRVHGQNASAAASTSLRSAAPRRASVQCW